MDDLIYNQRQIPREQWRYGLRASADTGCGWIAVYNALRMLGYRAEPETLIRYFERQLPLIHGNAGTNIWGPALYFQKWGFPVESTSVPEKFDALAKRSDACILFYRWRKGWKLGAHFVALRHTDGGFVGCNTFRSSAGPDRYGESLEGFLKQRDTSARSCLVSAENNNGRPALRGGLCVASIDTICSNLDKLNNS